MGVGQPLSIKLKNVHLPHPHPNGGLWDVSFGRVPVLFLCLAELLARFSVEQLWDSCTWSFDRFSTELAVVLSAKSGEVDKMCKYIQKCSNNYSIFYNLSTSTCTVHVISINIFTLLHLGRTFWLLPHTVNWCTVFWLQLVSNLLFSHCWWLQCSDNCFPGRRWINSCI